MSKILKGISATLMVLATIDLTIVVMGLTQIALEGRTGYWAPFWYVQAEFIINLLT